MKILANIGIVVAALLGIVIVLWEALVLTVFSATQEFWYAAQAVSVAILMLVLGILLRHRVRKVLPIGASLFFSLCAAAILGFHWGMREGYYPRMEISLPMWHFTAFTYAVMAFGLIPLLLLIKKWPNPSPQNNADKKSLQDAEPGARRV
jgi:hypothetical protein